MLRRDQLRYRIRGDEVVPSFLRPTPAMRDLAERLLLTWRSCVGVTRRELEEALQPVVHSSRSAVIARGLDHLIDKAARFEEPADAIALRDEVLPASAAALRDPAATADDHRAAVARSLDRDGAELARTLYADLPHEAELVAEPELDAETLLARYNLALAQGLILGAVSLHVRLVDTDVGVRRRLLKALRFHRLLATAREEDGALVLDVTGPTAVLEQSSRYGMQMARFLPDLCTAKMWHLDAEIELPRREGCKHLRLDHNAGLPGHSRYLAYVPEELRHLRAQLAKKCPGWTLDDEPPPLLAPGGELVVGDLALTAGGRTWIVECFHRWHAHALERRLEQKRRGELPMLLLGCDRALAKNEQRAALMEAAGFDAYGFCFSGFPTATALRKLVAKQESEDAEK